MKDYVLKIDTIFGETFALVYGLQQDVLEAYDYAMYDLVNELFVEIKTDNGHTTVIPSNDIQAIYVDKVLHYI